jgi:Zn-dependent oligopeptidase
VLDADAFERFQESGIFSPVIGQAFYETILCPGDSEDPAVLYQRFRGRPPEQTALLRRLGLLEPMSPQGEPRAES